MQSDPVYVAIPGLGNSVGEKRVRVLIPALVLLLSLVFFSFIPSERATAGPAHPPPYGSHSIAFASQGILIRYNPPTCASNVQPWPAEAQNAFEYAASLWESALLISQPIVVDACWRPMLPNSLGGEFPFPTAVNFENAPMRGTLYPVALANQLAGYDLNGGDAEMRLELNSIASFSFGTDGNPGPDQVDLVSVVLHEVAHGLGIGGSMDIRDGGGRWGRDGMPIIFDRFIVNRLGQHLIDLQLFHNPSPSLARQLTGGNVYFDGVQADLANGGTPPKLYAPRIFSVGSSIVHLDQATFGAGPDAVMTSGNEPGTATHTLGPVLLGMLQDLGWRLRPVAFQCRATRDRFELLGDC